MESTEDQLAELVKRQGKKIEELSNKFTCDSLIISAKNEAITSLSNENEKLREEIKLLTHFGPKETCVHPDCIERRNLKAENSSLSTQVERLEEMLKRWTHVDYVPTSSAIMLDTQMLLNNKKARDSK
jgi:hypothetical protein